MSRFYEMSVVVSEFDKNKRIEIEEAAQAEWEFDEFKEFSGKLHASGKDNLCGGSDAEKEFAKLLAKAIIKANGQPCKVTVRATCLEDLPSVDYSFE